MEDAVEDAVDEPARLGGAVPLGQFEGLVDGDPGRDLGAEHHLVGSQAKDVAVDGRHAVQPPVLGELGDQGVDPLLVLLHAGDQPFGELAELAIAQQPALDELADLLGSNPRVLLHLVENLKGDFTASGSSRHDRIISHHFGHAVTASARLATRGTIDRLTIDRSPRSSLIRSGRSAGVERPVGNSVPWDSIRVGIVRDARCVLGFLDSLLPCRMIRQVGPGRKGGRGVVWCRVAGGGWRVSMLDAYPAVFAAVMVGPAMSEWRVSSRPPRTAPAPRPLCGRRHPDSRRHTTRGCRHPRSRHESGRVRHDFCKRSTLSNRGEIAAGRGSSDPDRPRSP